MTDPGRELDPKQFPPVLPPSVENVRKTCLALARSPECRITIDAPRARAFIDRTDIREITTYPPLMETPMAFADEAAEVNYHVTLHLFNFGHGYRHPLHAARGAGAWQTMKRGLEAWHRAVALGVITADALSGLTRGQVIRFFDLGIRDGHGRPTSDTSPDLEPLAALILGVAHDTGRRLRDLGLGDFASFVYANTRAPDTGSPSAAELVRRLAAAFPGFNDRRIWRDGREVLFLKKAQITAIELHKRLSGRNPAAFDFPDLDRLTVACDNVLPCVLRALGILILPDALERHIDSGRPLPAGPEEAELRATALAAAEVMIEHGQGAFSAGEIGYYLWALGKDPRFRPLQRHATPDTCYY